MSEDTWPTRQEAAHTLKISTRTIDRYAQEGKIEMRKRPRPGKKAESICNPADIERLLPAPPTDIERLLPGPPIAVGHTKAKEATLRVVIEASFPHNDPAACERASAAIGQLIGSMMSPKRREE